MTNSGVSIAVIGSETELTQTLCSRIEEQVTNIPVLCIKSSKDLLLLGQNRPYVFVTHLDDSDSDALAMLASRIKKCPIPSPVVALSSGSENRTEWLNKGYHDVIQDDDFQQLEAVLKRDACLLTAVCEHIGSKRSRLSDFTGVHSRLEFLECIDALADAAHESHSALIYLQLDNFGWINENLGMTAGDRFLQDVGQVLLNIIQGDDFVARYQGGNFVLFVSADSEPHLKSKADMIREAILELSSEFDDNLISSTASLGVRLYDPQLSIVELIADAYDASDMARTGGGDSVHYFRPETDVSQEKTQKRAWNDRIKEAFDRDLFILYFQPIVSLQSDSDPRYEVLLRMQDEDSNIISPGTFLPFAERAGLMADIDRKVIVHTLEQGVEQREKGSEPELFIKLSGKSVDDKKMPSWIAKTLKASNYPAEKIVFEITESIALHHLVQTRNLCTKLKDLGCKIALDHFGTRFRSFKLLDSLHVDYLKIDGSLVQHLSHNKGHQAIVQKIVKIAKKGNLTLIAESVQEAAFLPIIWQYDIQYVQGFFLGAPNEQMDYDFRNLLI